MAKGEMRSAARLAAVQALYEMDVSGKGVLDVIAEFESHWMGREIEGMQFKPAEAAFFRDIVAGVVRDQARIDRNVDGALADKWPLRRIEPVLRAIMRAGAYELFNRRDVPAKASISEYIDVARAFYDQEEPGMVNGVLDAIARQNRSDELASRQ